MAQLIIIFGLLSLSYHETHVITDNIVRTTKCERYVNEPHINEEPLSTADSDIGPIISDYDFDVEICETDPSVQSSCIALWKNESGTIELMRKGCFQTAQDCSRPTCVSHDVNKRLHFCCCEGDLCNREFFYEPISTPSDEDADVIYEMNFRPILRILLLISFVLGCILTFMYVGIKWKYQYFCSKEKSRHMQTVRNAPSEEFDELRPIELLEVKAKGRFGVVWKAKFKNDYVAVKILPVEHRDFWLTEQHIFKLPSMDHENILHFLAAEERGTDIQKEYWIITAYQELGSLYDYLKSNIVTWEQLCIISFTMARGLAHLHEEILSEKSSVYKPSIAHRDFKSTNVLLKNDLSACIADFGFSFAFRSQICNTLTERMGTKRYMAPEVLEGAVGFSNQSFLCMDMYSCGLVLWEILSRCSVHEDAENGYKLPYETEFSDGVYFESFVEYVVCKKGRPVLKEAWKNNSLLSNVCDMIEECWDHDADARLSAACVTERFSWFLRSAVKSETKLLYSIV